MSLNDKKASALKAFDKIGKSNGTAPPESQDNRASIAYEYFIADALAGYATKRKEKAKKDAEAAGLLGEEKKPGDTVETYTNEHLTISARTAQPVERLDKTVLFNNLSKKYGAQEALAIIADATVENKAATTYLFAVK